MTFEDNWNRLLSESTDPSLWAPSYKAVAQMGYIWALKDLKVDALTAVELSSLADDVVRRLAQ